MKYVSLLITAMLLVSCAQPRTGPGETVGALAGGATGALVGSQFGSGRGKLVGTAVGTLGGALIGSQIGKSFDSPPPPRREYYRAEPAYRARPAAKVYHYEPVYPDRDDYYYDSYY